MEFGPANDANYQNFASPAAAHRYEVILGAGDRPACLIVLSARAAFLNNERSERTDATVVFADSWNYSIVGAPKLRG